MMQAIDYLFEVRAAKKQPDSGKVIKLAMDAVALAGNALHELNYYRRLSIKKVLPVKAQKLASKVKEESALLFGTELKQSMKDLAEADKLGLCLEKPKLRKTVTPSFAAGRGHTPNYANPRARFAQGSSAYYENSRKTNPGEWQGGVDRRPYYNFRKDHQLHQGTYNKAKYQSYQNEKRKGQSKK